MDAETVAAIEARAITLKDEISTDMKAGFASMSAQISMQYGKESHQFRDWITKEPLPAARTIGGTCLLIGGFVGFFLIPHIVNLLK